MLRCLVCLVLFSILSFSAAVAQDAEPEYSLPETNAYGPTVTNPATLTNVGIPEFEIFPTYSLQDGFTSRAVSVLVKYTWDPRWMAYGYSNTISSVSGCGFTETGFGSPTLGIKYLIAPPYPGTNSAQAVSVEWGLPTGSANAINSGMSDYNLNYYYTRWLGDVELDVNLWGSSLGIPGDTRRFQFNQSAALAIPITKNLTYSAEIYRFGPAGPSSPTVVSTLHAVNYQVGPALNLSFAVDFGLNSTSPVRNYIFGAVFYLGNPKPRANTLSQPDPGGWPARKAAD